MTDRDFYLILWNGNPDSPYTQSREPSYDGPFYNLNEFYQYVYDGYTYSDCSSFGKGIVYQCGDDPARLGTIEEFLHNYASKVTGIRFEPGREIVQ